LRLKGQTPEKFGNRHILPHSIARRGGFPRPFGWNFMQFSGLCQCSETSMLREYAA